MQIQFGPDIPGRYDWRTLCLSTEGRSVWLPDRHLPEPDQIRFWDSHGGCWETCSSQHPEAEAFGPEGSARRVEKGLSYGEAQKLGLVEPDPQGSGFLLYVHRVL